MQSEVLASRTNINEHYKKSDDLYQAFSLPRMVGNLIK